MADNDKHESGKKLHILIIEDSEDDAILLERELEKAFDFDCDRVSSANEVEQALKKEWDVIISDYQMPSFSAMDALALLHRSGKDIPFIIVSGTIGEDVAVEAMRAGAQDYLIKGNLIRLAPAIEREIKEAMIRQERNKANEALLAAGQQWQCTFDAIGDMVAIIDKNKVIQRANRAMLDFFKGRTVIGEYCYNLFSCCEQIPEECQDCNHAPKQSYNHFEVSHENGDKRYFDVSIYPFEEKLEEPGLFIHVIRDITEVKQREHEKMQGERLQALGQLAGGVAHDFNNNLTPIMGCAALLDLHIADEKLKKHVATIHNAAQRSAELTTQLLAFAKKGKFENKSTDIHKVITDVIALLSRSIDKQITIISNLNASPTTTLGDPSQLGNALLNIALNSRDAMEHKAGTIHFSTSVVDVKSIKKLQKEFSLTAETYIEVEIADTGKGMSESTLKQIFEPFFTTKGPHKGTGLGLAAAYGTILNHNGAIAVESKEGKGTTFKLYFPLHVVEDMAVEQPPVYHVNEGGGHVLVVDDEQYILDVAAALFEKLGYQPHCCLGATRAIAYYRQEWQHIDLIILDLIMADMTGEETFVELRKINPKAKVLISSGVSQPDSVKRLISDGVVGVMTKPYGLKGLASAVAAAMKSS